jgi:hypothetical protein
MNTTAPDTLPEKVAYLVMLAAPPSIWMLHFLLSYVTAAVWCARFTGRDGSLAQIHNVIAVYTVIALAGIAATGWSGYRRHRHGAETTAHDSDTPEDRHRFLGFATLLLAGLSAVATIYVAMSAWFFESCL